VKILNFIGTLYQKHSENEETAGKKDASMHIRNIYVKKYIYEVFSVVRKIPNIAYLLVMFIR